MQALQEYISFKLSKMVLRCKFCLIMLQLISYFFILYRAVRKTMIPQLIPYFFILYRAVRKTMIPQLIPYFFFLNRAVRKTTIPSFQTHKPGLPSEVTTMAIQG